MTIARVVIFPYRYVQGPGILHSSGQQLRRFGERCLIIGGKTALAHTKDALLAAFENGAVKTTWELFSGIPSEEEVKRLTEIAEQVSVKFIVGIGGGSALDTAKAVALFTQTPIITIPTVATMESATSTISVLYDQQGNFSRYVFLPRNPELILADSQVLANAPSRFLAAGIAGALATSYAVDACIQSQVVSVAGGLASSLVRCVAQFSREFCLQKARAALEDARAHELTPLLEDAFEIPLLFSTLCFESGGLAAAHAFYHGVRAVWPKRCRQYLSSEIVSFGTTVQLFLERRTEQEIERVVTLHADLGMPLTLTDLSLPTNYQELRILAVNCTQDKSMLNMPFKVSRNAVLRAIQDADRIGHHF